MFLMAQNSKELRWLKLEHDFGTINNRMVQWQKHSILKFVVKYFCVLKGFDVCNKILLSKNAFHKLKWRCPISCLNKYIKFKKYAQSFINKKFLSDRKITKGTDSLI